MYVPRVISEEECPRSDCTVVISQNFKCAVSWKEVSGYARKNQESRLNNGATKAASRGSVRTDDSPG
jgi:hypothetical protein